MPTTEGKLKFALQIYVGGGNIAMTIKRLSVLTIGLIIVILLGMTLLPDEVSAFKVLVVMSYDPTYPWSVEIREGITHVLPEAWDIQYTYLDTKRYIEQGEKKAEEAYALYQAFQPDGVIAADDNAQTMFVLPYLKEKVKTPVVFCGVNSPPENYGYPASNVTGVLEHPFLAETVGFLKQVDPTLKTIGHLIKKSPTGDAYFQQFQSVASQYAINSVAFKMPETFEEAIAMTKDLKAQCDALFIMTVNGLRDATGSPLTDEQIVPLVVKTFGKPTCTDLQTYVNYGVLCSVGQSGQVQGSLAAEVLLQLLNGTPLAELPIIRNYQGKRMLNVSVLKELGLKPTLPILTGTQLIK